MLTEGYIGITKEGRQSRRLWEHKNNFQNKHLKNALSKHKVVQDILLIADEEYCKDIERKLRPEREIGWNIEIGGSLPPNFKGKKRSESFINKLKAQVQSEETRAKRSKSMIGNKNGIGHKVSEENKATLSEQMKGTKRCLGKQNGLKYKYIGMNVKTGEQIALIGGKHMKELGFHPGHIGSCANENEKTHKGYTWIKESIK